MSKLLEAVEAIADMIDREAQPGDDAIRQHLATIRAEAEKIQAQNKHLESLLPRSLRARPWEGL